MNSFEVVLGLGTCLSESESSVEDDDSELESLSFSEPAFLDRAISRTRMRLSILSFKNESRFRATEDRLIQELIQNPFKGEYTLVRILIFSVFKNEPCVFVSYRKLRANRITGRIFQYFRCMNQRMLRSITTQKTSSCTHSLMLPHTTKASGSDSTENIRKMPVLRSPFSSNYSHVTFQRLQLIVKGHFDRVHFSDAFVKSSSTKSKNKR